MGGNVVGCSRARKGGIKVGACGRLVRRVSFCACSATRVTFSRHHMYRAPSKQPMVLSRAMHSTCNSRFTVRAVDPHALLVDVARQPPPRQAHDTHEVYPRSGMWMKGVVTF